MRATKTKKSTPSTTARTRNPVESVSEKAASAPSTTGRKITSTRPVARKEQHLQPDTRGVGGVNPEGGAEAAGLPAVQRGDALGEGACEIIESTEDQREHHDLDNHGEEQDEVVGDPLQRTGDRTEGGFCTSWPPKLAGRSATAAPRDEEPEELGNGCARRGGTPPKGDRRSSWSGRTSLVRQSQVGERPVRMVERHRGRRGPR